LQRSIPSFCLAKLKQNNDKEAFVQNKIASNTEEKTIRALSDT
jgi:hypothetical protein